MQERIVMQMFESSCSQCSCQMPDLSLLRFDASDWLDDQDIMRLFRISAATLLRMKRRKELPFIKCGGKSIFNRLLVYHCLLFKQKCAALG